MLPVLINFLRPYAPYIVWPVAALVGVIGYNIEKAVRGDRETPYKKKSISEERDERILKESTDKSPIEVDSLKEKKFVPKTIFRSETSPRQM